MLDFLFLYFYLKINIEKKVTVKKVSKSKKSMLFFFIRVLLKYESQTITATSSCTRRHTPDPLRGQRSLSHLQLRMTLSDAENLGTSWRCWMMSSAAGERGVRRLNGRSMWSVNTVNTADTTTWAPPPRLQQERRGEDICLHRCLWRGDTYLLSITSVLGHHLPQRLKDFDAQTFFVLLQQLFGVFDESVRRHGRHRGTSGDTEGHRETQ